MDAKFNVFSRMGQTVGMMVYHEYDDYDYDRVTILPVNTHIHSSLRE